MSWPKRPIVAATNVSLRCMPGSPHLIGFPPRYTEVEMLNVQLRIAMSGSEDKKTEFEKKKRSSGEKKMLESLFPGAMTPTQLKEFTRSKLSKYGFTPE
eukprot:210219-Amorphochlora_amoeboformis.AAC.1